MDLAIYFGGHILPTLAMSIARHYAHRSISLLSYPLLPQPTNDPSSSSVIALNPEYIPWLVQDQLNLGWIISSLTQNVLTQVIGCMTYQFVWSTLKHCLLPLHKHRFMILNMISLLLLKDHHARLYQEDQTLRTLSPICNLSVSEVG